MTILKPAVIAATIAFASPALAGGGPSFVYFPTLTYPEDGATVSKDAQARHVNTGNVCAQPAHSADARPNACGTLAGHDLASRKLDRDR